MIKYIQKIRPNYIFILCLIIITVLCFLDIVSGELIDFPLLYIPPIIIATWYVGKTSGYFAATACCISWYYSELSNGALYQEKHDLVIDGFVVFMSYFLLVFMLNFLKQQAKIASDNESLRKKEEAILKTTQSICGVIGQHVAYHNSEIIDWINMKKNSGHQVPEKVEQASKAIGESLLNLSHLAFTKLQDDSHLHDIERRLVDLNRKLK